MSDAIAGARLDLDFNPRALVQPWPIRSAVEPLDAQLDAIYVPCRGRPAHVTRLLSELFDLNTRVYLLPTEEGDLPPDLEGDIPRVERLAMSDSDFLGLVRSLRCYNNPRFVISSAHWDLPLKRNFALWHARREGFGRILLLDDDIRGLTASMLRAGASALDRWHLAGPFVDEFPDTSVIGHVELALGESVITFLSGSCVFLRADVTLGFFPPVYNEDWIFMAPEIATNRVASLGRISQEQYDPFAVQSMAAFQELGEIIGDGLFTMLAANLYNSRHDTACWNSFLSVRRAWLRLLAMRAEDARHRRAVDDARAVCDGITAKDCAGFVGDWEYDRVAWNRALRELP